MAWAGVTSRFTAFRQNVLLTDEQLADGLVKSKRIAGTLNSYYHGIENDQQNATWVGSWGKTTQARPPRDIDMFFTLPIAVYHRIQAVQGNGQSQLLQEVKNVLQPGNPQTTMRGDGQVVQIAFNDIMIEVLPAFELNDGGFYICDTHGGGSWTTARPRLEIAAIEQGDLATGGNLRTVIRMLKIWKRENNVPIKSYLLETLATQFMLQSPYANYGVFWYDWIMRDAFQFLVTRANTWLTVPDGQQAFLGEEWKSRAQSAHDRALMACAYEKADMLPEAGDEWQKIFGLWILKHVVPEQHLLGWKP